MDKLPLIYLKDTRRAKRRTTARQHYDKCEDEINAKRKEERAKNSTYCKECGQNVRLKNWDERFNWVRHTGSELNMLSKDFNKRFYDSKLSNEEREENRRGYYNKKRDIYKRLSEIYPNSKWNEEVLDPEPLKPREIQQPFELH